jgi:hypothetical protein
MYISVRQAHRRLAKRIVPSGIQMLPGRILAKWIPAFLPAIQIVASQISFSSWKRESNSNYKDLKTAV